MKSKFVQRIQMNSKCVSRTKVCTGALSASGCAVGEGQAGQLPGSQYQKVANIFNIRRGGGQDARKSILEGSKYATVHMVTNMVTSKYLIFNCQRKVKNI